MAPLLVKDVGVVPIHVLETGSIVVQAGGWNAPGLAVVNGLVIAVKPAHEGCTSTLIHYLPGGLKLT